MNSSRIFSGVFSSARRSGPLLARRRPHCTWNTCTLQLPPPPAPSALLSIPCRCASAETRSATEPHSLLSCVTVCAAAAAAALSQANERARACSHCRSTTWSPAPARPSEGDLEKASKASGFSGKGDDDALCCTNFRVVGWVLPLLCRQLRAFVGLWALVGYGLEVTHCR